MQNHQSGYRTFADFWPHYLDAHRGRLNRALHAVGTCTFLVLMCYAICSGPWWLLALAPVGGYGLAWLGHLVARTHPASFHHPLWSLRADFKMCALMLCGRLAREVARSEAARTLDFTTAAVSLSEAA